MISTQGRVWAVLALAVLCAPVNLQAEEPAASVLAEEPAANLRTEPAVYEDYVAAVRAAREQQKMLFVLFCHPDAKDASREAFETRALANPLVQAALSDFVVAKVPVNAKIKEGDREITLIEHGAYEYLEKRQGIAIVDFKHKGTRHYGYTVTAYPFRPAHYITPEALKVILTLPPGTLTQRTLIFAVRIHPERPGSTVGNFHPLLAGEAEKHSSHQASILLQGHHNWENRYHQISARLNEKAEAAAGPVEVCAESWPNQSLVDAAIDCVHSWRQSPGHWNAVRERHGLFGFDMKRGKNGIWYATGIFARGR